VVSLLQFLRLDSCSGFWCGSTGPGTPFATPLLAVCDVVRIACTLGGVAVIVALPGAIRVAVAPGQRSRLIGLGLFALIVLNSQAVHLGDDPTIRLPLTFAAIAFCVHGMWSIFRHELPAQPRDDTGAVDAE